MKKTGYRIATMFLALTLFGGSAFAAGEVYVNNAETRLSGELKDAYAVGSNGVSKLDDAAAYAITTRRILLCHGIPLSRCPLRMIPRRSTCCVLPWWCQLLAWQAAFFGRMYDVVL